MYQLLQSGLTKISGLGLEVLLAHCPLPPIPHVNKACGLGLNFKSPSPPPQSAAYVVVWGGGWLRCTKGLFRSYTLFLCFCGKGQTKEGRQKTDARYRDC